MLGHTPDRCISTITRSLKRRKLRHAPEAVVWTESGAYVPIVLWRMSVVPPIAKAIH